MHRVGLVWLIVAASVAGCLTNRDEAEAPPTSSASAPAPLERPAFSDPIIIDDVRAGGEPAIVVTRKGTILVASHPGYTHAHPDPTAVPPTGPEVLTPTQGQSYMFRSTDGGKSWAVVGLAPVDAPNSGPRGEGQGVGDPDFAIDANGRIYFTDLEALGEASVSWSDDDGATWPEGNNAVAGAPNDRQWLTTVNTTVYFRSNYQATDQDVRKSEDGGQTWTDVGDAKCGGDVVANPSNGKLYVACGNGVSVSEDGGATWKVRRAEIGGVDLAEVAIDTSGNLYIPAFPGFRHVTLLMSRDDGRSWRLLDVSSRFPELEGGTVIWPWASAGSTGRVSVTFYGSPQANATRSDAAEWFVYNALIMEAWSGSPTVFATKLTPAPFHRGPVCQAGTLCQTSTATSDQGDRRLGDLFETAIDPSGFVHIVYADTQHKPSDVVSHVGYVRQTGGEPLLVGSVPKGFPTQG